MRRSTTPLGYCPRPACEKPIRAVVETERNGDVDTAVILDHACIGRPHSGPPKHPRPGACPSCDEPTTYDPGYHHVDAKTGATESKAPSVYCAACGWTE